MDDILQKIKKAGLSGRSGSGYPVADKWLSVAKTLASKKEANTCCYVVCNGSEGEPGVMKDGYILANHADEVIKGMMSAIHYFSKARKNKPVYVEGIIYLNPGYYKKLEKSLKRKIKGKPIKLFRKSHDAGYIGGEETSALNHIEGRRVEPRFRPPYPPVRGLWGSPTLVHNVETYYDISLINDGRYEHKRFYTINGDCLWTGVYEFPTKLTIKEVLEQTHNLPKFEFFVQIGGDACGPILNSDQLDQPASGAASITVYSVLKHEPVKLIRSWLNFYIHESCGQCTPCREGIYRLKEIFDAKEIRWVLAGEIMNAQAESSFCGLGCSVPIPIRSFIDNVISNKLYNIHLPNAEEAVKTKSSNSKTHARTKKISHNKN